MTEQMTPISSATDPRFVSDASVLWSGYSEGQSLADPLVNGVATLTQVGGVFSRVTQGSSWLGGFNAGEALFSTGNSGPPRTLQIALSSPVRGVGFAIQGGDFTPFWSQFIWAVDGFGGSEFQYSITAHQTASFIGAFCSAPVIQSIGVVLQNTAHSSLFAINKLLLMTGSVTVVTPAVGDLCMLDGQTMALVTRVNGDSSLDLRCLLGGVSCPKSVPQSRVQNPPPAVTGQVGYVWVDYVTYDGVELPAVITRFSGLGEAADLYVFCDAMICPRGVVRDELNKARGTWHLADGDWRVQYYGGGRDGVLSVVTRDHGDTSIDVCVLRDALGVAPKAVAEDETHAQPGTWNWTLANL